ncbi:peptidase M15 [Moraxella bovoculi]|uniref:Peptidase M15 n=1 Tax=Moraxella bovoculi TaxID=386891 RepID=A0AAC8PY94_9GAMM|nr:D-Ala-D-Ala carboxypeptidase family metallohydrolase [Moraxella bovoculi]AKG08084.1 peptidase M15 [Moraxella bovoculi]AKG11194.1 peptidase M15 [Moraxella bovoculi]
MTQLTKNFTLAELTRSDTASRLGLNNTPDERATTNLRQSARGLWQPVRDILGVPMRVSSGYRSPTLNRAISGSTTSAHCHGLAIDFVAPAFGDTRKIARHLVAELKERGIKFDQLILEFPDSSNSWIHLGYKHPNGQQRGQVLTAVKRGGRTVYLSGLR